MEANNLGKTQCSVVNVSSAALIGLAGVGLLRGLSFATSAAKFLWRKHLRPGKHLIDYGQWAVVTGASDGIGREYCNYLAKQGLNIFLVSRTQAKLEAAAAEIGQEHGVKTKILQVDLAEAGAQSLNANAWTELSTAVQGMDVGVLINNAATIQRCPSEFHIVNADSIDTTISLNDTAVLKLTHVVLPGMVKRGRGAIINVSSIITTFPATPLLALYTASKGFLNTFSTALAAEYGPKGIDVQVQMPGPVATEMVRAGSPESGFVPSPAAFVKHAGRHIGYETVCIPYPYHALAAGVAQALPACMVTTGFRGAMGEMRRTAELRDAAHTRAPALGSAGEGSAVNSNHGGR